MKTGFSLSQRYVPVWNKNKDLPEKDQLVAIMKMPTVDDTFAIIERLQANGIGTGPTDSANVGMKRARAIAVEAGSFVPTYITLEGAEDFSVNDVISYPQYFQLAVELLFELVRFAQPNEADEKN